MPLTFIDIERQKTWRIGIFFVFLMALYFVVCLAIAAPFLPHAMLFSGGLGRAFTVVFCISFVSAAIHFWFTASDAVADVCRGLKAQTPDPNDRLHKVFVNIMQEIHAVTGNRRHIDAVIIPTLSMNALAAEDLKGNAVIAVTEGLLSRLSRQQLETVIAHETHHILSGDCLQTTVAASLFGTISSFIENSIRFRVRPPALVLAWLVLQLTSLVNLFISREREYRADAAAVRMTRDPLALAETLYLLSRNWRGAGFIGSGYEMLCIINPELSALDESEGFVAELFSTHPPIRKRIDILLCMAHTDLAGLIKKMAPRLPADSPGEACYYALDPQKQWQGPFTLRELGALPWLSPLSWVKNGDLEKIDRAWGNPFINLIFADRIKQEQKLSAFRCPSCRQQLVEECYEGTQIYQCRFCSGTLVENDKIPRILARTSRDLACSERIKALAKSTVLEQQHKTALAKLTRVKKTEGVTPLLACPKCKQPMYRGFYSAAFLIEIDRCSFCGLTWFDQDELQMIQSLTEQQPSTSL